MSECVVNREYISFDSCLCKTRPDWAVTVPSADFEGKGGGGREEEDERRTRADKCNDEMERESLSVTAFSLEKANLSNWSSSLLFGSDDGSDDGGGDETKRDTNLTKESSLVSVLG